MLETTSCLLCNSSLYTTLYTISDFWLERKNTQTTFVRCANCGFIYQNPRPSMDEMSNHYPQSYQVFETGQKVRVGIAQRYGLEKRASVVLRFVKSGRLLDVGCASGSFLYWMSRKGNWKLNGIEPSPHPYNAALKKGLDIFNGTLEEACFETSSFDAVTLWDVIEHLHKPIETLTEVNRVLKPNGIVVLRLPNMDSIDAKIFGQYWAGLDAPRHLYVFNRSTLQRLLNRTGLKIIYASTHIGGYLNFVKSIRFYLSANNIPSILKTVIISLFSSFPIRAATMPFFWLKDQNLRGSELIVVAKKENSIL